MASLVARRPAGARAARRRQRGVVVLIALIATVVMAFAGFALVSAVDATARINGNLALWEAAVAQTDAAIEDAIDALFERRLVTDTNADDPAYGYLASRQPGEDARGVPAVLRTIARDPSSARVIDAGHGIVVRYVIERMCVAPGPATPQNCTLVPAADSTQLAADGSPVDPPRVPHYRQTIRADGPAGARVFVQAWLGDAPARRRISWRAIAD
jgi:hypothetical protein